ncbi:MAG: hypothetical protein WD100_13500 [Tistlia sp.]|uniref:hypothetical protein n=1 Tax=Tistlia sp. TaxID=3057121 RepID=UPI0034A25D98
MTRARSTGRLDGILARLVAGLVLLAAVGGLLAIHWQDLFPEERPVEAADPDDPAVACIAERSAQIEAMIADNPGMAGQKALFLERAEAMCRATAGGSGSGGPPPLPSN